MLQKQGQAQMMITVQLQLLRTAKHCMTESEPEMSESKVRQRRFWDKHIKIVDGSRLVQKGQTKQTSRKTTKGKYRYISFLECLNSKKWKNKTVLFLKIIQ